MSKEEAREKAEKMSREISRNLDRGVSPTQKQTDELARLMYEAGMIAEMDDIPDDDED